MASQKYVVKMRDAAGGETVFGPLGGRDAMTLHRLIKRNLAAFGARSCGWSTVELRAADLACRGDGVTDADRANMRAAAPLMLKALRLQETAFSGVLPTTTKTVTVKLDQANVSAARDYRHAALLAAQFGPAPDPIAG